MDTPIIPHIIIKTVLVLVSPEDSDLEEFNWDLLGGKYARRKQWNSQSYKNSDILLHRVILERMLNRPLLKTEYVDHKDGNTFNNQRDNLRLATRSENTRNAKKRKDNPSGYKGVTKDREQWRARITVDKKQIYLGAFDTPEDAHKAYCEASKKYHGEFSRTE